MSGCQLENLLGVDCALKFSADNVDHNTRTLDGKDTFHGMGMIAIVSNGVFTEKRMCRRVVADEEILQKSKVPVLNYREKKHLLKKLTFNDPPKISLSHNKLDVLWKVAWCGKNPILDWNGCMQLIHENQITTTEIPSIDTIVNLPIIDMDPSNMTCILSTLKFLTDLAHKYSLPSIITFDQPLFWKASKIINESVNDASLQKVVLMLGSFHTVMNLLGYIGTLMEGSGLNSILQEVYGDNAVLHMLTGKAYSRAIRGHFMVDYALSNILMEMVIDDLMITDELQILFDQVTNGEKAISDVENSPLLIKVQKLVEEMKTTLATESRTSKLWIGYQRVVNIFRKFIRADRLGLWDLHLEACQEAVPVIAAAGHFNYIKSEYLYLQKMLSLEQTNPTVYRHFKSGGFVVRRSERHWAGLGCDLTIEQVLMRSLKTTGGLTRGTGLSDVQRSSWLLSKPVCSAYRQQMQENVGVFHSTSEQHKTIGAARLKLSLSQCGYRKSDQTIT